MHKIGSTQVFFTYTTVARASRNPCPSAVYSETFSHTSEETCILTSKLTATALVRGFRVITLPCVLTR